MCNTGIIKEGMQEGQICAFVKFDHSGERVFLNFLWGGSVSPPSWPALIIYLQKPEESASR